MLGKTALIRMYTIDETGGIHSSLALSDAQK
jgi:hypothetical protein